MENPMRTHSAGSLNSSSIGADVRVAGWVHSRRDHGGVYFFDLRDRSGLLQVVVHPENAAAFLAAGKMGAEWVVSIKGKIGRRPAGTENAKIPTGEIELTADEVTVLNTCKVLPFEIDEHSSVNEDARLKYRFLDLRRRRMLRNLTLRHTVAMAARNALASEGFLEIETPILTKATPEGARDFLVPARLSPGSFYALPQSPQIFKQILMVSGVEKYMQLARAFRDEDLRSDRQPEHTQIDVEMSFVREEDVHAACERMMKAIFKEAIGFDIQAPFPRLDYFDAMKRFGSDKPDQRYGLEIVDLTAELKNCGFKVFGGAIAAGGVVRAISCASDYSRSEIDKLTDVAKVYGAKGLAWIKWTAAGPETPIAKFLTPGELEAIKTKTAAQPGMYTFFAADKEIPAATVLGAIRKEIIARLKPAPSTPWHFSWVTHFPLLEWEAEEKRWTFAHNPFTRPLDRGRAEAGQRTGRRSPLASVRPGPQRRRTRLRLHPQPPGGTAAQDPRADGFRRDGAAASVRPPAVGARLRRAASRRVRPRPRPPDRASVRRGLDPRGHRLPEDAERHRPPLRGARPGQG